MKTNNITKMSSNYILQGDNFKNIDPNPSEPEN